MLRGSVSSWRRRSKQHSLAKPRLPPLEEAAIPVVDALGRQGASPLQTTSDRGGAIPIATAELPAERPGLAAAAAAHYSRNSAAIAGGIAVHQLCGGRTE
jgi:hypothetical protein